MDREAQTHASRVGPRTKRTKPFFLVQCSQNHARLSTQPIRGRILPLLIAVYRNSTKDHHGDRRSQAGEVGRGWHPTKLARLKTTNMVGKLPRGSRPISSKASSRNMTNYRCHLGLRLMARCIGREMCAGVGVHCLSRLEDHIAAFSGTTPRRPRGLQHGALARGP